jgi:5-methylcytosine-specific restriction endonuclease McrA
MALLSAGHWRLAIELFLLAGVTDEEGLLPSLDLICWYLRAEKPFLVRQLETLEEKGIVKRAGEGWQVVNFSEIQAPPRTTSTERVRRYRARREENGAPRTPQYDPQAIFRRDDNRCVYCGSKVAPLCVDHVYPIIQGGTDDYRNLATACKSCNSRKAGRTPEDADMFFVNEAASERYEDYYQDHT